MLVEFKTNPIREPMQYAIMLLSNHLQSKKVELVRYQHNEDVAKAVRLDIEDLTRALQHIKE